jgi:hypothetical protein
MNKYITFSSARLLHNRHGKRPSYKGDLDSNVTGKLRGEFYKGVGPNSGLFFVRIMLLRLGCF